MCAQRDPDHRIAALAAAQHGPVAHRQLRELGLTNREIGYRLAVGRLHRVFPEVYLVGHKVLPREGRWMAAVLTCGRRAVLSHGDAAAHWDLLPARGRVVHVTTPSRSGRDPDSTRIRLHRVGTLRRWECTLIDGIPTTTVARTLLDLSPSLRPRAIEDVIGRADRLGLFDLVAVRRCLAEHPRQHGAPALRRTLATVTGEGAADVRSALEVRLLQLCDDHALPRPAVNTTVSGVLVDFHWPGTTVVVETDGYAFHSSPTAFERDRERDQHLTLAGYTVVRFTYNQVTQTPEAVAHRIRSLLGRGSPGAR
jgi:very-short-patch-repair endonuclease